MEIHFYHIRLPPLNVTILLRTCIGYIMGATPMFMIVLYPNPCYNDVVCYKGTALYVLEEITGSRFK